VRVERSKWVWKHTLFAPLFMRQSKEGNEENV